MADDIEETTENEAPETEVETETGRGRGDRGRRRRPRPRPRPPRPRPGRQAAPAEDGPRPNRRKVREGVVVSDAMQSTVVVAVVERVRHPRYGKTVQRTKKLYVHDAEDTAKVGDRVRVQETRPLSKLKRWRLTEVVERAR